MAFIGGFFIGGFIGVIIMGLLFANEKDKPDEYGFYEREDDEK